MFAGIIAKHSFSAQGRSGHLFGSHQNKRTQCEYQAMSYSMAIVYGQIQGLDSSLPE